MKFQISLLALALSISPVSLFAQATPPFSSTANYSAADQIAADAPPSPLSQLEAIAEPALCSPESEPVITLKADSNETDSDIPEQYTKARRLIRKGAWRQAQLVLKNGIEKFPNSRHLRMVYADLLWHLSGSGRDQTLLEQSSKQAVKAMEIGLDLGIVDQQLVALLSDVLSRTQDTENFERLFSRMLALDSSYDTRYRYARGLSRMNSPRTEEAFKATVALRAEGSGHADYGEWLLDRGRYADVLELLPQTPQLYYLSFLRGVALEHLGQLGKASNRYKVFRDYSKFFPAPARFRIKGSKTQRGIHFDDEPGGQTTGPNPKQLTDHDATNGLTYMIWGEARGESYGGKLAVGWVARARTLRGTLQTTNPCPFPNRETFASLADAYKAVLCQSGAFDNTCDPWCADPSMTCSWDTDSNNAAFDVYQGTKADPVSGHCPGGISSSGYLCTAPFETCNGYYWSYRYRSPMFYYATLPGATCGVQQSCAPDIYGQVCGNGGSTDHCFSGNLSCLGPGMVDSYATISTQGIAAVTTPYYAPSGFTHQAHLEAPEGSNFDEYLQYSYTNNGTDWANYYSNPQPGATEDVKVTTSFAAYFRWRIIATQGTGRFDVCNKRPQ